MTSSKTLFCLMFLFFGEIAQWSHQSSFVHQDSGFISKTAGESITLKCFYKGEIVARFYWYKQTLGQKPVLISSFYTYDKNGTFYDECQNNPRFTLDAEKGQNHLKITDLRVSDSATYFCASSFTITFEFADGITVSVKGSDLDIHALVQQSESEIIQPGGSETLTCTVHTGTCDGEHSVYWFRDSQESIPSIIYTHEDRTNLCERKLNTRSKTCVYNLPMKDLTVSHTGTYYCAVASCGYLLFGNGTKLAFESEDSSHVSVYILSAALAFTIILILLLALLLYTISTDSCTRVSDLSTKDDQCHENVLKKNKINSSRRQKDDTWSECVYFSVKL